MAKFSTKHETGYKKILDTIGILMQPQPEELAPPQPGL
jgi:hypothetical protein